MVLRSTDWAKMEIELEDLVTLRCCRDWPIHAYAVYGQQIGRCGICNNRPSVVWEIYPEEKYARNQAGYTPPLEV